MTKEDFILMHISNHCCVYATAGPNILTKPNDVPAFVVKDAICYGESIWDQLPDELKPKECVHTWGLSKKEDRLLSAENAVCILCGVYAKDVKQK